jgi:hypothetical protein
MYDESLRCPAWPVRLQGGVRDGQTLPLNVIMWLWDPHIWHFCQPIKFLVFADAGRTIYALSPFALVAMPLNEMTGAAA